MLCELTRQNFDTDKLVPCRTVAYKSGVAVNYLLEFGN